MRILLSLVGEQPTPNLIPLYHAAHVGQRFDGVKFLVSGDERFKEVAGHLSEAIKKEAEKADSPLSGMQIIDSGPPVDAWQLDKARADCESAIQKCLKAGHEVTVNLTGGTKIMSLAAYQAAVNTGVPMLYVNTAETQVQHYDHSGQPTESKRFQVKIPIETQLRAAGREFKRNPTKPRVRPADISQDHEELARLIAARYVVAHTKLIRKVLNAARRAGQPAAYVPSGQSVEVANRIQAAGLWRWDEAAGTLTITNSSAWNFLNGGWVEVLALCSLGNHGDFNEVLGNVEIEGFAGELDVVATHNGRLGIIECKTEGPSQEERLSFAIAKVRLHEVILGGPYAAGMFVLPSDENIRSWQDICRQYALPEPVYGANLSRLPDELLRRLRG